MLITYERFSMSYGSEVLSNRTMSAYPVSIGTSLFLESLSDGPNPPYDPERIIPDRVDITQYDEMYVNCLTLFRNIIGAVDKDGYNRVTPIALRDVLEFEIDLIKDLINDISYGKTKVIFYASDYSELEKKYPHARLRNDTTEKQKIYTALLVNTLNAFFKDQPKSDNMMHFKLELKPKESTKALIVTNYAIDLLSYKYFKNLDLLESHTGQIKHRPTWNSKYLDHKNLTRMPFNKVLLQIFGDAQTFFAWPKETRDSIIELANKYKWTGLTTTDRVKFCITNLKDPHVISIINQMF